MSLKVKEPKEAREQLIRQGMTVRQWARQHGVHEKTVYEVLAGRKRGLYGEAHKVAVLLGIKDGVIE